MSESTWELEKTDSWRDHPPPLFADLSQQARDEGICLHSLAFPKWTAVSYAPGSFHMLFPYLEASLHV